MTSVFGDLADLVLPGACVGCGADRVRLRNGACPACVAELEGLRPHRAAPSPPPPGFPPCVAVGPYAGALRGALLAYKEKGRHRLARPLGALLAGAVAALAPPGRPVLIVPVPSTRAARRERYGDHMTRLTTHAVQRLRAAGWTAWADQPLRALPRPDSTSLDAAARSTAAVNSLRINPARISVLRRGGAPRSTLVIADDIVTTGATLAAAVRRLEEADMQVTGAAVLAATQLRRICPGI
ncbi:ComF family protein [Actinoplanes awajinensis]|uniref:Phosphoribosyltransferase n=1 Tax=Actinoplanes awajinensis subsp. mycoplanecinus TaxID=135947 RepID=A0A0X3UWX1_9ACTN|nr:phosphoribosyltransferase family protein [Actinoplanes awajinensis]KUL36727.1 phosphoribosyltransferase [Actinoplanes awajinensis subsp. mycoplanecinus]